MRIIVVGAGPAGLHCATRLAPHHDVTLLGDEPGAPYNRVALSQWLAGDYAEHELTTPAEAPIQYRGGAVVTAIDRGRKTVTTGANETLGYDALVLAVGADAIRLPVPGANLPHVVSYRTRADVGAMLAAAEAGGDAVVIGGGLLGLEAAAGLAHRGMRVTVLHAGGRVMERQLDHPGAAILTGRIAARGIRVITGGRTARIEPGTVHLSDGRSLPADLVVMAIGIAPRTALARDAGVAVQRGIVVDDFMRTSDAAIYAVGECAEHAGVCCGLVAPARALADAAASAILGEDAPYRPATDATALKVAGAPVWSGGEMNGADTITLQDGLRAYRKLVLRDGLLVGAVMVGDTDDSPWYHTLIRDRVPVDAFRAALPFGQAYAA